MSILKNVQGDKAIWIVVITLAIFSFLPVYSASSNFGANLIFSNIIKHISIIFIGIMIMYSTHLVEYKYFKGLSLIVLPLVIILLFFTSFQGNVVDGANANRWLNIPILEISFQPSTLASIFLLIYLSNFLSKEKNKNLSLTKTFLLMWLPIMLVVALILPSTCILPSSSFSTLRCWSTMSAWLFSRIKVVAHSAIIPVNSNSR